MHILYDTTHYEGTSNWSMLLSTMTSQSRGADTNEGLVVSILGQLTQLHAH